MYVIIEIYIISSLRSNMKTFLVGYTGFVGSNLNSEYKFDKVFNSKNIEKAFNENPDLLVYSGVPAQKFIANQNPEADFDIIKNAIKNIEKIKPRKIVLISTIDVYENPVNVDEDNIPENNSEAYGRNRRYLEKWVEENFKDYLIVRLPGLYGENIKKNFIYDLINYIPTMLKDTKYNELIINNPELSNYYTLGKNNFFECKKLNNKEKNRLKEILKQANFSALNFTDSRGSFQFYNLAYLWKHIQIALKHNIKILNIATEPIKIRELYQYIYHEKFTNELSGKIPDYNFKTKYAQIFKGKKGYILNKEDILEDIKNFVNKKVQNLKIGISNIAWNSENDGEIYEYLKTREINHLEIAPTKLVGEDPYNNLKLAVPADKENMAELKARELKEKYDIVISSIQSVWYGRTENIFASAENYNKLLEYTKKAIDFAHVIHCSNIVFGCPKNRNITDYHKDYPKAIKFFQKLGNYAKDKNVIIAIEPNPPIYNTNFLNTTEEALNFVKEVNNSNIKINYDLGTVIANNEDLNVLEDNIDYINHIHISEPNLVLIEKRELHKRLIEILKKKNYDKVISIEMKETSVSNVKKIIDYVNDLIKG